MPAYWNGTVYFGGDGDAVKAFSFNAGGSGMLSSFPTSRSSTSYNFPGATPTVSANETANGILWAIQTDAFGFGGTAILHAYDATNLATELYNSNQNSSRDNPGPANKFAVPVVANGKVYVAAVGKLSVYGLLNAGTRATTSTALSSSPNPSTVGQAVTLTGTVTSPTSGTRTGTVTFLDGATSLGTGTLNAGGAATLQFTFQSAGQHSITAKYAGDSNFADSISPAVTQSVNSANSASDFSVSASPPSASVNPGGAASFTLTLNPVGGFTGAVSVSCSGAPPASACTASPSSVTLNGSSSASVTVQIATSTAGSVSGPPTSRDGNRWVWLLLLQLTIAAAVAIRLHRKRVLGIATATGLLFIAGCGNGGGMSGAQKQATPSGTYTLTLTATAGTNTHSTTVQLKVN
jgi:hypothetical protein